MSAVLVTLSSKGQIVIPKEIRDQLNWHAGTQITLMPSATGVTLKQTTKKTGRRLEDLIGMLKHDGPALSTQELCAPVDYAQDGMDLERRTT